MLSNGCADTGIVVWYWYRSVGDFVGSVGDTEAGRKGTGGVDFSNAAGMGGL